MPTSHGPDTACAPRQALLLDPDNEMHKNLVISSRNEMRSRKKPQLPRSARGWGLSAAHSQAFLGSPRDPAEPREQPMNPPV